MNLQFSVIYLLFANLFSFSNGLTIDGVVSLYDPDKDDLQVLTKNNFNDLVYKSDKVWFVEFYAHWCGACQRYAHHWREVAKETRPWHAKVLQVAAINCGDAFNDEICKEHNVGHYPTLKLFSTQASRGKENHDAIEVQTDKTEVMMTTVLNLILKLPEKPLSWPELEPYT